MRNLEMIFNWLNQSDRSPNKADARADVSLHKRDQYICHKARRISDRLWFDKNKKSTVALIHFGDRSEVQRESVSTKFKNLRTWYINKFIDPFSVYESTNKEKY